MAKRKMAKKQRRTRRNRAFNIANAAELYLTTDVLTRNFMGTNPFEFITGQTYGQTGTTGGVSRPMATYGYSYNPGDMNTITLPELLGFGQNTRAFSDSNLQLIKNNIKNNGIDALIQYAGVKIGFKVASKLLSKQRSFVNNQVLPMIGAKSLVRV